MIDQEEHSSADKTAEILADPVAQRGQRRVIDFFVEVRLYPRPLGKKTFDPETVQVTPRGQR